MTRRLIAACLVVATAAAVIAGNTAARPSSVWLTTRSAAESDLTGDRFRNIRTATCSPDRSSPSKVFGQTRYWQRFWCQGSTYDHVRYRLRHKTTGKCEQCWTIINLSGTGPNHLRTRSASTATATVGSNAGNTGSCGAGYYGNVDGECIPGPSTDPGLTPEGPTAVCRDGTYSYSQHRSGTCSHHGGVARWL